MDPDVPAVSKRRGNGHLAGRMGMNVIHETRAETPDTARIHTVSRGEDWGASLEQVGPSKAEHRQVHDGAPLKVHATGHQAEQETRPRCGRQNRERLSPGVTYPVQHGQNGKTLLPYLCICQLLPYDRFWKTIGDLFGKSMTKATRSRVVPECFRDLSGVGEEARDLLAGAQVLNADETWIDPLVHG